MEDKSVEQAPVTVEVKVRGYLDPDRKEWFLPSGYEGEILVVTETKDRQLSVHYLREGIWRRYF